ncbi:hypothetical protein T310_6026, partial [Rasamsonia emersonii CBS 393.64]
LLTGTTAARTSPSRSCPSSRLAVHLDLCDPSPLPLFLFFSHCLQPGHFPAVLSRSLSLTDRSCCFYLYQPYCCASASTRGGQPPCRRLLALGWLALLR